MELLNHLQFILPEVKNIHGEFDVTCGKDVEQFIREHVPQKEHMAIRFALMDAYVEFCHKASACMGLFRTPGVLTDLEAVIHFYSETSNPNQLTTFLLSSLRHYDIDPYREIHFKGNRFETPEDNSIWEHSNGNAYKVLCCSNLDSTRLHYPPTVTYRNTVNNNVFSKTLHSFYKSMEKRKWQQK